MSAGFPAELPSCPQYENAGWVLIQPSCKEWELKRFGNNVVVFESTRCGLSKPS